MSSFRFFLTAALTLALARPLSAQVFNPSHFTLENGLEVVVVENHRAPVVSHMVWYKVGSADEVPGKSGLAHLFEHLMFKGTPTIPPGEFSKRIARMGGQDNAFTSTDYTAYFQNVPVERLDEVMSMEADRMRNLVLDDANVTTERDVVLEERRSRTDNNPSALLHEQMQAALYLNHPYGRPVIGWASEISQLDRTHAMAFYKTWYAPNNAVLVVAGDVTPDQVRHLATRHYGPLKPEIVPPRQRVAEPPPVAPRRVVLTDARVRQPSFNRSYLAPTYRTDPQAYALEILADIIGGSPTARLYQELGVKRKVAASASAWYDPSGLDSTTFGVGALPNPDVSLDKLEAALNDVLADILKNGISEAEVTRSKDRLIAQLAYARDSLHTGARVLGEALTTGQTIADVEAWPRHIAAVTTQAVNDAARKVLNDRASVTGLLLPSPDAPKAGPAAPPALAPSKELH